MMNSCLESILSLTAKYTLEKVLICVLLWYRSFEKIISEYNIISKILTNEKN